MKFGGIIVSFGEFWNVKIVVFAEQSIFLKPSLIVMVFITFVFSSVFFL